MLVVLLDFVSFRSFHFIAAEPGRLHLFHNTGGASSSASFVWIVCCLDLLTTTAVTYLGQCNCCMGMEMHSGTVQLHGHGNVQCSALLLHCKIYAVLILRIGLLLHCNEWIHWCCMDMDSSTVQLLLP